MSAEHEFLSRRRWPQIAATICVPETRALYHNFCDRDNVSTVHRLTVEGTLAADRFFLRRLATDPCALWDRGDYFRLQLLRVVLATPPTIRPKHFPCVLLQPLAPSLREQLALCFEPVGLRVASQSKSAAALGNKIGS